MERIHDGLLHHGVDSLAISPAEASAHTHGYDRIDDTLAQFLEVIEKTHGGHGLFFTVAACCRGCGFKHAIPARSRRIRHWKDSRGQPPQSQPGGPWQRGSVS